MTRSRRRHLSKTAPYPQKRRAGSHKNEKAPRGAFPNLRAMLPVPQPLHQHLSKEPQIGIEPMTARLRIGCSTTELLWQTMKTNLHRGFDHALARTRTATPYGTTPSRWRVYQFHHQGEGPGRADREPATTPEILLSPNNDGSDGARTRDLSSDSRVL